MQFPIIGQHTHSPLKGIYEIYGIYGFPGFPGFLGFPGFSGFFFDFCGVPEVREAFRKLPGAGALHPDQI